MTRQAGADQPEQALPCLRSTGRDGAGPQQGDHHDANPDGAAGHHHVAESAMPAHRHVGSHGQSQTDGDDSGRQLWLLSRVEYPSALAIARTPGSGRWRRCTSPHTCPPARPGSGHGHDGPGGPSFLWPLARGPAPALCRLGQGPEQRDPGPGHPPDRSCPRQWRRRIPARACQPTPRTSAVASGTGRPRAASRAAAVSTRTVTSCRPSDPAAACPAWPSARFPWPGRRTRPTRDVPVGLMLDCNINDPVMVTGSGRGRRRAQPVGRVTPA